MRWQLGLVVLLASTFDVSASWGDPMSFQGNFTVDDNVTTFDFSLPAITTVTLRTWSFGGGTDGAGDLIPAGGFAPVLSLFSATGTENLLATDYADLSGVCGARHMDPASGFCWDALINTTLGPGSYILALTEDDNTPNGPTLGDGFLRSGMGNFTGPEFLGGPGQFILVDGSQRTSAWEVDLVGIPASGGPVPEPASGVLLLVALVWICGTRRRT